MPNPACSNCKPDKPETHENLVKDTGCTDLYKVVDACMKLNQGNISDCAEEWKAFRYCFASQKVEYKPPTMPYQHFK